MCRGSLIVIAAWAATWCGADRVFAQNVNRVQPIVLPVTSSSCPSPAIPPERQLVRGLDGTWDSLPAGTLRPVSRAEDSQMVPLPAQRVEHWAASVPRTFIEYPGSVGTVRYEAAEQRPRVEPASVVPSGPMVREGTWPAPPIVSEGPVRVMRPVPQVIAPPVAGPVPRPVIQEVVPNGYVLGRGLVGQPKLYKPGQPVLNFFRYISL
ncbi:MAG: hypothetical protein FJ276_10685 [Planctomycetes bacterium]|nr:hypothetical protein [Planctomycetota bacterium]